MPVATCFFCAKVMDTAKIEDHAVEEHGLKRHPWACTHSLFRQRCSARFATEDELDRHKEGHRIGRL